MIEATAYCDGCRTWSRVFVPPMGDGRFHPEAADDVRDVLAAIGWTSRFDPGRLRVVDLCPKCGREEEWEDEWKGAGT